MHLVSVVDPGVSILDESVENFMLFYLQVNKTFEVPMRAFSRVGKSLQLAFGHAGGVCSVVNSEVVLNNNQ